MTFLPIVGRELRVRARKLATYRNRLWSTAIALLLLVVVPSGLGAGGRKLYAMGLLTLLWSLLQGAIYTADCLSEEKRNGTMGLLFLTDLRGYDVVLGKLMATSLNSLYALLAVLPVLSLPLLLGGAMAAEYWRLVLVLINTLFFSLSVGLCASAVARRERAARGTTLLILLFFVAALPLARWSPSSVGPTLSLLSPASTFHLVFDARYQSNASQYWLSLLLTHLAGWGFLLLACGILPRAWQDIPLAPRRSPAPAWPAALSGQASPIDYRRTRLLAEAPVTWLATRHGTKQFYLWALTGGASVVLVLMWMAGGAAPAIVIPMACVAVALHLLLAGYVAAEATHALAEARDSGALELLLATPLTTEEIIEGFFGALKRLFYRPVALFVFVEVALLCAQAAVTLARGDTEELGLRLGLVGLCLVTVVLDLFAVARYGLWKGLSAKKPIQAFIQTIAFVSILPVVLSCFCYPVLGLIKNLIFINYSRQQLRAQFLTIVTQRFAGDATDERQPPPSPVPTPLPSVLDR